jgi:pimeloyl-[acyl-carrier protein] methyl ester esterase
VPDDPLKLLFVHGWAGHPDLWNRMIGSMDPVLDGQSFEATAVNLGVFGSPSLPVGHFDVAIGHSAGVLWLLSQRDASFASIVSIAGCTRFCSGDTFAAGWPVRVVRRMSQQLHLDADRVLDEFWNAASTERAGHPNFPKCEGSPDAACLATGLQALQELDCREQWNAFTGGRLVIAGTEDRIVTADHTRACYEREPVEWLKTDSHWIPWTFPETCAALVAEMIETRR